MKIFKINKDKIPVVKDCSLAIGFFDGVHIGHQKVITKTINYALKNNVKAAVLTFAHAPRDIINHNKFNSNFSIRKENFHFLKEMGVNYLFVFEPQEAELHQTSAKNFINQIIKKLKVKHIACGQDFRFGKNREASGAQILELADFDLKVDIVNELKSKDKKISSMMIKKALKNNDLVTVKRLTGRPYSIIGRVSEGDKIGRKMGFRTANINIFDEIDFLLRGVFYVEVIINNNSWHGIANIGYRPSVNTFKRLKLEIHIFNFNKDIYGKEIKVVFKKFIRPEKSFTTLQDLKNQILDDVVKVKKLFVEK